MAKTLSEFTIKRPGRVAEEIDFDPLFDGKVHELEAGKDFKSKVTTFRQRVGKEARARGGHVETRVDTKKGLIQLRFDANGKKPKRK